MANEGVKVIDAGVLPAHVPCEHRLEQVGEWTAELTTARQVHGLYHCPLCGEMQESLNPIRYYDGIPKRNAVQLADLRTKAEAERDRIVALAKADHAAARAEFLTEYRQRQALVEAARARAIEHGANS